MKFVDVRAVEWRIRTGENLELGDQVDVDAHRAAAAEFVMAGDQVNAGDHLHEWLSDGLAGACIPDPR